MMSTEEMTWCAPGHVLQFEELERRRGEMVRHLMTGIGHRDGGVRMRHLHRERIELAPLVLTEHFNRRHLHQHRLRRHLDGRHRDLVAFLEIFQRLDVWVARDQRQRLRGRRHHAFHAALGAVPKEQEIAHAGIHDVDAAGQHRVGLRAAAAEHDPVDLEIGQAEPRGMFLDELLLRHDVRRHVIDAGLPRDGDFFFLLRAGILRKRDEADKRPQARQIAATSNPA